MGKRGPQPTPTSVLENRGSWRAKIRTADAPATPGTPNPPEWLQGESLDEWDRLTTDLQSRGLLTLSDRPALVLYCSTWGEFVMAQRQINEHGSTHTNSRGLVTTSPWVKIRRDSMAMLDRIGQQFGYSPSSRVGLPAAPPASEAIDVRERKARFFQ